MSCGLVANGDRFLAATLDHLACAGSQLASAGYQSVAGAPFLNALLLTLLTLFVAFIGVRLMFKQGPDLGDATIASVKVGIVLMLAVSWPAVRTLAFDPIVKGPAQVLDRLGGEEGVSARLQRIDDGVVALTSWGTGKLDIRVGRTASGEPAASAFSGEATNESLGFSVGRMIFLTGTLASLGGVLLASGLMIALLPLFAGFLLFDNTRGIFFGWAKSMAFLFIAGVVVPAILLVEANILEPWLAGAISERQQFLATPSAPIELVALTSTFALLLAFALWLSARLCFNSELIVVVRRMVASFSQAAVRTTGIELRSKSAEERFSEVSRATHLASVLDVATRREHSERATAKTESTRLREGTAQTRQPQGDSDAGYRRPQPREAASRARRDRK